MKILLTGATGYIGKRLLPVLLNEGHQVICIVRDKERFVSFKNLKKNILVIEGDFLNKDSLKTIPEDIDTAYYLIHSMSDSKDYSEKETLSAINFRERLNKTTVKQVIYLSGIVNDSTLSEHLKSRYNVELELKKGNFALTTLRAGIIIGSGSASFEIIRDLVEKLPVMIAPKWLKTKCQPIAISDVIKLLITAQNNAVVYNNSYDIAGPDVLSYKDMLLLFAKVRKLKRKIITIPVMSPRLSSYWLYFVTSTSYKLAISLVESMKVEVVAKNSEINKIFNHTPISYENALLKAFRRIEQNEIVSSWKDSFTSGRLNGMISDFIKVPSYGCLIDQRQMQVLNTTACIENIWKIGGHTGWYSGNTLWKLRGFIDKLSGGVGLKRGRTDVNNIYPGDTIDFWRVIYANKEEGRLLLYAEMKLPGEAWLEFNLSNSTLEQTATFRPKGVWGRLYWFLVFPFHEIVFGRMIKNIVKTPISR